MVKLYPVLEPSLEQWILPFRHKLSSSIKWLLFPSLDFIYGFRNSWKFQVRGSYGCAPGYLAEVFLACASTAAIGEFVKPEPSLAAIADPIIKNSSTKFRASSACPKTTVRTAQPAQTRGPLNAKDTRLNTRDNLHMVQLYCICSDRGKQRQKTKREGQLWQAKCFKQIFYIIQKESSRLVNPFWRLWLWKARVLHAFYLQDVKKKGVVFCMSSIIAASLLAAGPGSFTPSAWALTEENLLFLEAWRTIDRAYVDKKFNGQNWFRYREDALRNEPMRTREDTYAAIRKMLETLQDPFTRFLEPEKFRSLVSGTSGAITGVGLEVGFDMSSSSATSELVVVAPLLGGPAARAGILPGDVVLSIDGRSTQGMSLYEAAQWLQGPESTVVKLTVQCKDQGVKKDYALMREKITLNPVQWYLCDVPNGESFPFRLGYIRLSTFNQNAYRALKDAVEALRESGANAYILDIRNNGGGFFPAAIDIAKMWLDKGVIVYIADSLGVRDIYEADGTGVLASNEPLAVLVNKGTASASEILAGALKDNQRAVILGEPTFGKGKIQSVFGLSDGSGIAVTVARYETPGHIDIDKVGISPDFALPASFPVDGERFCKCIEGSLSGCTFPTKVFFPNNNRQSISVK